MFMCSWLIAIAFALVSYSIPLVLLQVSCTSGNFRVDTLCTQSPLVVRRRHAPHLKSHPSQLILFGYLAAAVMPVMNT